MCFWTPQITADVAEMWQATDISTPRNQGLGSSFLIGILLDLCMRTIFNRSMIVYHQLVPGKQVAQVSIACRKVQAQVARTHLSSPIPPLSVALEFPKRHLNRAL